MERARGARTPIQEWINEQFDARNMQKEYQETDGNRSETEKTGKTKNHKTKTISIVSGVFSVRLSNNNH